MQGVGAYQAPQRSPGLTEGNRETQCPRGPEWPGTRASLARGQCEVVGIRGEVQVQGVEVGFPEDSAGGWGRVGKV